MYIDSKTLLKKINESSLEDEEKTKLIDLVEKGFISLLEKIIDFSRNIWGLIGI